MFFDFSSELIFFLLLDTSLINKLHKNGQLFMFVLVVNFSLLRKNTFFFNTAYYPETNN